MLDLRLLADSNSGAEASPSPTSPPVMEMRLAAAFIAGLLVDRQYAKGCQHYDHVAEVQHSPELRACDRTESEAGDVIIWSELSEIALGLRR